MENIDNYLELLKDKKLTIEFIENRKAPFHFLLESEIISEFDIAYFDFDLYQEIFKSNKKNFLKSNFGDFEGIDFRENKKDNLYFKYPKYISQISNIKRQYRQMYMSDVVFLCNTDNFDIHKERLEKLINDKIFNPFPFIHSEKHFEKLYKLGFNSNNIFDKNNEFFKRVVFEKCDYSVYKNINMIDSVDLFNTIADYDFKLFEFLETRREYVKHEKNIFNILASKLDFDFENNSCDYFSYFNNLNKVNVSDEDIFIAFTFHSVPFDFISNNNYILTRERILNLLKICDDYFLRNPAICIKEFKDNLINLSCNLEKKDIIKNVKINDEVKKRKRL